MSRRQYYKKSTTTTRRRGESPYMMTGYPSSRVQFPSSQTMSYQAPPGYGLKQRKPTTLTVKHVIVGQNTPTTIPINPDGSVNPSGVTLTANQLAEQIQNHIIKTP